MDPELLGVYAMPDESWVGIMLADAGGEALGRGCSWESFVQIEGGRELK